MSSFKVKVAIVTGGGSGLGEAISKELASKGANVVITDIDLAAAERVAGEINRAGDFGGQPGPHLEGHAVAIQQDTATPEDSKKVVDFAVETFGALHLAVNNAGIGGPAAPAGETDLDAWRRVIDINLNGVLYGMRYQIPAMLEAGAEKCAIVNMASIHGSVAAIGNGAYTAAKQPHPRDSGDTQGQEPPRPPWPARGGGPPGVLPPLGGRLVHDRRLLPGGWRLHHRLTRIHCGAPPARRTRASAAPRGSAGAEVSGSWRPRPRSPNGSRSPSDRLAAQRSRQRRSWRPRWRRTRTPESPTARNPQELRRSGTERGHRWTPSSTTTAPERRSPSPWPCSGPPTINGVWPPRSTSTPPSWAVRRQWLTSRRGDALVPPYKGAGRVLPNTYMRQRQLDRGHRHVGSASRSRAEAERPRHEVVAPRPRPRPRPRSHLGGVRGRGATARRNVDRGDVNPHVLRDGDGAPTSPNPAPRALTPADDGRTYTMTVGQVARLVVSDPEAPDPEVDGTSVLVIPVVNITASGQREWELRAIGAGNTTIRGQGTQPYVITLEVVDP